MKSNKKTVVKTCAIMIKRGLVLSDKGDIVMKDASPPEVIYLTGDDVDRIEMGGLSQLRQVLLVMLTVDNQYPVKEMHLDNIFGFDTHRKKACYLLKPNSDILFSPRREGLQGQDQGD